MSATTPTPHKVTTSPGDVKVITAPLNMPVSFSSLLGAYSPEAAPPFTGGTLTDPLILAGDATAQLGAVTLRQMNAAIAPLLANIAAEIAALKTGR